MGEKADEQITSMLIEQEELRRDVLMLEQRMAQIEGETHEIVQLLGKKRAGLQKQVKKGETQVGDPLKGLRDRVKQMEVENRNLAELCEELRAQNEAISNLYVAKHRLHATFKPNEVMNIVQEIVAELIGAKQFGILMLDQKKKTLRLVAGRGVDDRLPGKILPVGEGIIGDVAVTGKPFFFEPTSSSEQKAHLPLATIPMKMREATVGVVVIYQLLSHKKSLSPIDHQLLELVAEHAPKALLSAHLFSAMSTKRPVGEPI